MGGNNWRGNGAGGREKSFLRKLEGKKICCSLDPKTTSPTRIVNRELNSLLASLQAAPTVNVSELGEVLKREKKPIETMKIQHR